MQIKYPHKKLYQISRTGEAECSKVAYEREKKLEKYYQLRVEGCSQQTALRVLDLSRATFYRWRKKYRELGLWGLENASRRPNKIRQPSWDRTTEQLILKIRTGFPLWGKNKIAVVASRDHQTKLSASTVGRVLVRFFNRGTIQKAHFFYGRIKAKQSRAFRGHAQRWRYGMKSGAPGELVQIDHAVITLPSGLEIKHFKAVCPYTKMSSEQAYANATSTTARKFLDHTEKMFHFKIKSVQVDGGSEFMKYFEVGCEEKKIDLYVLPPRSPKYNGCVERGNSTVKYEFYALYDGPMNLYFIRDKLQRFVKMYNTYRPHQALQYQTPWQYYKSLEAK